jgi:glycerophosphoryl diester phosphodiesterase
MKNIITHRGFWLKKTEQNQQIAFERALEHGFGIETDLRDANRTVVISHDIPSGNEMTFEDFIILYKKYNVNTPLALNIKSDGLQRIVKDILTQYNVMNYFCFDMSVPDALHYHHNNITFFTRQSEYENAPLKENANGVWMDAFVETSWITHDIIAQHIKSGKKICFVSPELHKRSHQEEWDKYKQYYHAFSSNVMFCTDHPTALQEHILR